MKWQSEWTEDDLDDPGVGYNIVATQPRPPPPPVVSTTHAAGTVDKVDRQPLQRQALRTFETIRAMLSADQEQLFSTFQDFDVDLSGRLERREFRRMLQSFDPSVSSRALDDFLRDIDGDGDNGITFTELLDWWELQKVNRTGAANDVWFLTQLKARFAAQVAKDLWNSLTGSPPIEERLTRLSVAELSQTVTNYEDDLYLLRLWMHDARTRSEEELEGRLMKQAESLKWAPEELEDLRDLFQRVASGGATISVEGDLPRLCALLNFDIPHSCMERTAKLFDRRMTFQAFLVFWGCRPEADKLRTGKNPVWRWGVKSPVGPDAPKPLLL